MNFKRNDDLKNITIIGAGTLGRRVALMFSIKSNVYLYDIKQEILDDALKFINGTGNDDLVKKSIKREGSVNISTNLSQAVNNSWLVIEAVPENLQLKKNIFKELSEVAPKDAILTSNSSSYEIKEFWDNIPENERYKLLNTHFMMPPLVDTVEILGSPKTDPQIVEYIYNQFKNYYFIPFIVQKESTGFIFNRIWAAIKRECCRVIQEGVASPESVNNIFKINFGIAKGPVEMMDQVGLDVVLDIEKNYVSKNPSIGNEAIDLLEKYVSQGKLGVKTGEGFFKY